MSALQGQGTGFLVLIYFSAILYERHCFHCYTDEESGAYKRISNVLKDMCTHMLSHVQLFATPWTVACQAPLSVRFPRQGYWSGLPFPTPRSPGTLNTYKQKRFQRFSVIAFLTIEQEILEESITYIPLQLKCKSLLVTCPWIIYHMLYLIDSKYHQLQDSMISCTKKNAVNQGKIQYFIIQNFYFLPIEGISMVLFRHLFCITYHCYYI